MSLHLIVTVDDNNSIFYRARHNTTLSYICILSIVDFVSMVPLPMTIIDQVLGFWMFGTFACKLFRLFEHIGKIFSTFILVCFSIDRYCAVCHPLKNRLRNPTTAYVMLCATFALTCILLCPILIFAQSKNRLRNPTTAYVMLCATFALTCILLCPILIFAQSKEIVVHEKYNHVTNELTRLHLYKCVDDLGNELFILFTLTCFLFAYLVPLLLMIYFYYGMLMRLIKQTRTARKSLKGARRRKSFTEEKIPIARIAVTPYWISVLYSLYLEIFQALDLQMPDSSFIYFMYGVHALPYINSASNFILYGLLNRQLHQIPNQMNYRRGTMGRQSINRNVP
uniref:G_PROTEIN_RECEP_F1_2 domain-containing protein n=1 Tax=Ascaris lumbricoides TaxID=6252 RepID=A0A0M3ILX5_ASCLU